MWFSEGFFGGQHYLFTMEEKQKQAAHISQAFDAQVADLLKALVCLPCELLIAKLNAYRFGLKTLKLMDN